MILSLKGKIVRPEENFENFQFFKQKIDLVGLMKEDLDKFIRNINQALDDKDENLNLITQYYFNDPNRHTSGFGALVLAKAINSNKSDVFNSRINNEQMKFAQVLEMIHFSGLIQDDVLDDAKIRTGQTAIHTKVGKKSSVFAADFMVATSFLLCSTTNDMRLMKLICSIFENMSRGEIIQEDSSGSNLDNLLVEYCQKSYFKLASILSHSYKGIGLYGKEAERCFMFGKHMGLAFQCIDDLLDLVGSTEILGKPVQNDLKSGTVTAPVLFAAYFDDKLAEMIKRKFSEDGDIDYAHRVAFEFGVEPTRKLTLMHLRKAMEFVSFVDQGPAFDALTTLCGKFYTRGTSREEIFT